MFLYGIILANKLYSNELINTTTLDFNTSFCYTS